MTWPPIPAGKRSSAGSSSGRRFGGHWRQRALAWKISCRKPEPMPDFPITNRTRMRRKASRATYDRDTIYAIVDEALTASVAAVIDGRPQVQPMIHVRIGDDIILHGLGGNQLLSVIAAGGEACINVMLLDALAMARRIEDHSMLYRSATMYGRGQQVRDEAEKAAIMDR